MFVLYLLLSGVINFKNDKDTTNRVDFFCFLDFFGKFGLMGSIW